MASITPSLMQALSGVPGASVVSRNWLVFRRKEFSFPARRERRAYPSAVCEERATKREAKRTAARRVAPKTAWGFVAPRSQSAAAMLPRRALPQAVLGATKHQPIARHHTSVSTLGWMPKGRQSRRDGRVLPVPQNEAARQAGPIRRQFLRPSLRDLYAGRDVSRR